MTNLPSGSRPVSTGNQNLIREDIERTRDDLGQTMEALAAKTDVKARSREAADHAKAQARQKVATGVHNVQHQSEEMAHKATAKATEGVQRARRRPAPVATAATAAGAAAAAAGAIIFLRRRRAAKAGARRRIWRLWQ
jgi:hypothetical protein